MIHQFPSLLNVLAFIFKHEILHFLLPYIRDSPLFYVTADQGHGSYLIWDRVCKKENGRDRRSGQMLTGL